MGDPLHLTTIRLGKPLLDDCRFFNIECLNLRHRARHHLRRRHPALLCQPQYRRFRLACKLDRHTQNLNPPKTTVNSIHRLPCILPSSTEKPQP